MNLSFGNHTLYQNIDEIFITVFTARTYKILTSFYPKNFFPFPLSLSISVCHTHMHPLSKYVHVLFVMLYVECLTRLYCVHTLSIIK